MTNAPSDDRDRNPRSDDDRRRGEDRRGDDTRRSGQDRRGQPRPTWRPPPDPETPPPSRPYHFRSLIDRREIEDRRRIDRRVGPADVELSPEELDALLGRSDD